MRWWRRWLYRWSGRLPCYLITRCGAPYLERYYLGSVGPYRAYLHRFVTRDPIDLFHTHQWVAGWSLVLSGSYTEELFDGSSREHRGLHLIDGATPHRTSHLNGEHSRGRGDCWTLFVHGPYSTTPWSFRRRGTAPVSYGEYLPSAGEHRWWENGVRGSNAGRAPLDPTVEDLRPKTESPSAEGTPSRT